MKSPVHTPLHALIKSRMKFADLRRRLGITEAALRSWLINNHVPVSRLTDLANALDVELRDLLVFADRPEDLEGSDATISKPPGTIDALLAVKRGETTIADVAKDLGLSEHSLLVTYAINNGRLELLKEALYGFSDGRHTSTEAGGMLGVSRTQVHYLMRVFGVPKPKAKPKSGPGRYLTLKPLAEKVALDVIAGRTSAKQASEEHEMSNRTLHRHIKRITPYSLNEMSSWPASFRLAYALELEGKAPKLIEKLLDFVKLHGLILRKNPMPPKPVVDWRRVPTGRILLAVLLGEFTLDEIVAMRGGAKEPIVNLCDGELKRFRLRMRDAMALPVVHQAALADLMLMEGSYFRRGRA